MTARRPARSGPDAVRPSATGRLRRALLADRVRHRCAAALHRRRVAALPIAQCGVAAGVALLALSASGATLLATGRRQTNRAAGGQPRGPVGGQAVTWSDKMSG